MRYIAILWRLCLLFAVANAQGNAVDGCPKNEVACHDVMNGSQCLAQIVNDNNPPISAQALAKCVQHEGTASNLTGSTKLCRCPGCHTPAINAAISKYFPAPCS
ncbi:hypothetical protein B0T16DRAFT_389725 [Cercophora newfieldiana]|uniref:Uncharacterized protein n=1 Tax=Cercophora newfieldiana TaxID=92897 RepID=A0AA40CSK9_9PEZI|nr:hypothetical protein B0T16DRAFT_389725 [Cercophora newfieldiana]